MGNIGWFILIYFAVGWVLDVILMLGLVALSAWKDAKNGNEECLNELGDQFEYIGECCEAENSGRDGMGKLKAWLIGRLTWPISIPIGLNYLWSAIKEAEVKKE